MAQKFDELVYNISLKNFLVPVDKLNVALKDTASAGVSLATLLVRNKDVTESDLMKLLAKEFNLEYVGLKGLQIDKALTEVIPYRFAWHYRFVPLKLEKSILTIAVLMPLDIKTQDELRLHFSYTLRMVIASERDIIETLARMYGIGADTLEKMRVTPGAQEAPPVAQPTEEIQDIEKLAENASVIQLVNQIILEAARKRATDIHIEPYRGEFKLRYRIDGLLYDATVAPHIKRYLTSILSRIKIMSNLNIVERRLPQDGRAIVKTQEQVLDLRVSFIPTPYGESLVIRILPTAMTFSLEKLGLSSSDQRIFATLIERPHGIIMVTGPTGSGKTTTLYACLSRINKGEKKIVTIEDPIEYEITGVVQIQVMPEIGLTFARGLRSMLRHDPDVMMVGEVRDLETAEIAMRAALTGHLVFSTLHTNDAASGVTRLIDIGIEPYLIASSVEAFIAQRLVRIICPLCRKEDLRPLPEVRQQIAREINAPSPEAVRLYHGQGCQECNFTGFRGRMGIFELLVMDEALKEMVLKKPSSEAIKKNALAAGMVTLRQDGWQKVIAGLTTPEEIMKVTQPEKEGETGRAVMSVPEVPQSQVVPSAVPVVPVATATGQQRRIFDRLLARVPLHWKIYPADTDGYQTVAPEFIAATKNISAGGLLFSSPQPLAPGLIVELQIELPQETPLTCLARVVRVEEIEAGRLYHIAVCFLDLSGADRLRLNRFVEHGT